MDILLKITDPQSEGETPWKGFPPELIVEIVDLLQRSDGNIYYPVIQKASSFASRGALPPTEIIVALGSAGVFSAVFQVISSYLTKNKDREITLEHNGSKITIKGHSLPEEKELLQKLLIKVNDFKIVKKSDSRK
jgi:hypothetical protein